MKRLGVEFFESFRSKLDLQSAWEKVSDGESVLIKCMRGQETLKLFKMWTVQPGSVGRTKRGPWCHAWQRSHVELKAAEKLVYGKKLKANV